MIEEKEESQMHSPQHDCSTLFICQCDCKVESYDQLMNHMKQMHKCNAPHFDELVCNLLVGRVQFTLTEEHKKKVSSMHCQRIIQVKDKCKVETRGRKHKRRNLFMTNNQPQQQISHSQHPKLLYNNIIFHKQMSKTDQFTQKLLLQAFKIDPSSIKQKKPICNKNKTIIRGRTLGRKTIKFWTKRLLQNVEVNQQINKLYQFQQTGTQLSKLFAKYLKNRKQTEMNEQKLSKQKELITLINFVQIAELAYFQIQEKDKLQLQQFQDFFNFFSTDFLPYILRNKQITMYLYINSSQILLDNKKYLKQLNDFLIWLVNFQGIPNPFYVNWNSDQIVIKNIKQP